MSRKTVLIREHEGVILNEMRIWYSREIFITDNKIESFSFVSEENFHDVSIRINKNDGIKSAIALDLGNDFPISYVLFKESGMGEYQRIKRELEEMFDLDK